MTLLTVIPDSSDTALDAGSDTDIPAGPTRPVLEPAAAETRLTDTGRSPLVIGLSVMAAAVIAVFVSTAALMLALTDVSMAGAIGLGAYCAFWLGGGFGTIFGSAMVFGRDH